jgi:hypothetical protein
MESFSPSRHWLFLVNKSDTPKIPMMFEIIMQKNIAAIVLARLLKLYELADNAND